MKKVQHLVSFLLLGILMFSIIPLESFHTHEEAHIVCKEGAIHIEDKDFECELCDFVLPVFESKSSSQAIKAYSFQVLESDFTQSLYSRELYDIPQYRGPPSV